MAAKNRIGDEIDFAVTPSWRRSSLYGGLALLLVVLSFYSSIRDFVDHGFARKVEYQFRTWIGKAPDLDPRIKMIAFDDSTASRLQRHDLALASWGHLIEYLAKSQPQVIFVDRIFGLPLGRQLDRPLEAEEAQSFIDQMKGLKVPVIVGAFVTAHPIAHRDELDRQQFSFRPEDAFGVSMGELEKHHPWLRHQSDHLYGPHSRIRGAFPQIGVINHDGHGMVRPLFRVSKTHLMAHSAILTAGGLQYRDQQFFINDHPLPLDQGGRLMINLSELPTYMAQTRTILSYAAKINAETPEDWLEPGDIVAVLPMMYTGNTDMKDVATGRMPGSFINLSAVSNAINGNWLVATSWPLFWIVLAGLLGGILGVYSQALFFYLATLIGFLVQLAIGLMVFSHLGWVTPWPFTVAGFVLVGISVFVEKAQRVEKAKREAEFKAQEGIRVRKLLHVVCHDIANPLMIVTARSMMMGGDYEKVLAKGNEASSIDKIAFAGEKIRTIIESVRTLEAVETGKIAIKLSAVQLKEVVQSVQISFQDRLEAKNIQLNVTVPPDLWVMADATALESFVLSNLVSNAIKFSPEASAIELIARRVESIVEIQVLDRGIGIPEELRDKIFSSTAVTTREGTKNESGTGFGMPIVQSYVHRFGGSIVVESMTASESPDRHGTTITIRLKQASAPGKAGSV